MNAGDFHEHRQMPVFFKPCLRCRIGALSRVSCLERGYLVGLLIRGWTSRLSGLQRIQGRGGLREKLRGLI